MAGSEQVSCEDGGELAGLGHLSLGPGSSSRPLSVQQYTRPVQLTTVIILGEIMTRDSKSTRKIFIHIPILRDEFHN